MDEAETTQLLRDIDTKLAVLIALHTHRLLLDDEDLAKPRPRSIDRLLLDAGLSQTEIGRILGKTRQAVSHVLRKGEGRGS